MKKFSLIVVLTVLIGLFATEAWAQCPLGDCLRGCFGGGCNYTSTRTRVYYQAPTYTRYSTGVIVTEGDEPITGACSPVKACAPVQACAPTQTTAEGCDCDPCRCGRGATRYRTVTRTRTTGGCVNGVCGFRAGVGFYW